MKIPFVRPNSPRLSVLTRELVEIEESGVFSNYGPVNSRLEREFESSLFSGEGHCLTVCNATIGLIIALKHVARTRPGSRNLAIMPSFTFAATAHAALWSGLTPLLCDIDEESWTPSAAAEERLLRQYGDEISVLLPYATFGNCIDLDRYEWLSRHYGVPVVVDAAASLGSLTDAHHGFGTGFPHPVVFSMHATKAFATGEAGLIYCAKAETIAALRTMGNFGFSQPRTATMPGLNSKLTETGALLALAKLREFDLVASYRAEIADLYRAELPDWTFQRLHGQRHAFQFMPVLLPESWADRRDEVVAALGERGIGVGAYFSPHVAEQPYFRETCIADDLSVTNRIARRMISLPISDFITPDEISFVCRTLREICGDAAALPAAQEPREVSVAIPTQLRDKLLETTDATIEPLRNGEMAQAPARSDLLLRFHAARAALAAARRRMLPVTPDHPPPS